MHAVRTALARNAGRPVDDIASRVAASVAHLGLVARLLAPAIAAAALGHRATAPADVRWQDRLGGSFPLSMPANALRADPVVDQLTTAMANRFPVPPRVLWGNVASAANSAARLITPARPGLAAAAHDAANTILADPRVEDGCSRAGPSFRRRSCCLIYRLSGSREAVCGDCVLTARTGR